MCTDCAPSLQANLWSVVSVPDGAPSSSKDGPIDLAAAGAKAPAPGPDRKFSFLLACKDLLQSSEYAREVCLHCRCMQTHAGVLNGSSHGKTWPGT